MAITSREEYVARHAALVAGLARLVDDYVAASDKRVATARVEALTAALAPDEIDPAAPADHQAEIQVEPVAPVATDNPAAADADATTTKTDTE